MITVPRVAASHLRPGDTVRIGARARRTVRETFAYDENETVIIFNIFDDTIDRIMLRPNLRRAGMRRVFAPSSELLETVLGPRH